MKFFQIGQLFFSIISCNFLFTITKVSPSLQWYTVLQRNFCGQFPFEILVSKLKTLLFQWFAKPAHRILYHRLHLQDKWISCVVHLEKSTHRAFVCLSKQLFIYLMFHKCNKYPKKERRYVGSYITTYH